MMMRLILVCVFFALGCRTGSTDPMSENDSTTEAANSFFERLSSSLSSGKFQEHFVTQSIIDSFTLSEKRELIALASKYSSIENVSHLEKLGLDFNELCTETGLFPINIACRYGNVALVEYLVGNTKIENLSISPFESAITGAHESTVEIVAILLAAEVSDQLGNYSAVIHAVKLDLDRVLTKLINGGANAYVKDDYGWTVYHHAVYARSDLCLQALFQLGINCTALSTKPYLYEDHSLVGGVLKFVEIREGISAEQLAVVLERKSAIEIFEREKMKSK